MNKFLLIVVLLILDFPFLSHASPHWAKLNKSPVCFGAKGNQFGRFTYNGNIFVNTFMLLHRSGKVTCNRSHYSYWGCTPNSSRLEAILTDDNNKILAPPASKVNSGGKYTLAGFTSSSSALVLPANKKPQCIFSNSGLRLWHGEDLKGHTESDNGGRTCADVYALLV